MKILEFLSKIFFYFRHGHGTYFAFLFSAGTFALVSYNFVIKNTFLSNYIPNMISFFVILGIPYGTLVILVAWKHFKSAPYRVEEIIKFDQHPRNRAMFDAIMEIREDVRRLKNEKIRNDES